MEKVVCLKINRLLSFKQEDLDIYHTVLSLFVNANDVQVCWDWDGHIFKGIVNIYKFEVFKTKYKVKCNDLDKYMHVYNSKNNYEVMSV